MRCGLPNVQETGPLWRAGIRHALPISIKVHGAPAAACAGDNFEDTVLQAVNPQECCNLCKAVKGCLAW